VLLPSCCRRTGVGVIEVGAPPAQDRLSDSLAIVRHCIRRKGRGGRRLRGLYIEGGR